jgi:uncharacterized protein YjbI with pentapeptide repeats
LFDNGLPQEFADLLKLGILMRHTRIFVVLMLLLTPFGARSQQAPPPLDEPCLVQSDERWTPQEKFVWEHVCVGKVANFNTAPDYGGELDPMKPEDWPHSRVLRPTFLATILLKEPYSRALPPAGGVMILGARFVEMINLDRVELRHTILLADSLVENDVHLSLLKSKYPIGFVHSKVTGNINMNGLDLDSNLALQESQFAKLELTGAHVRQQVDLRQSKVADDLLMNGLHAKSLRMLGGEFSRVDLAYTHVSHINLHSAKVTGLLDINSARVDTLLMGEGRFATVNLQQLRVGDLLSMRSAHFASVDLNSAHVGGPLLLSKSKVDGNIDCFGLVVDQHVWMDGAKLGGSFECRTAKIVHNLYMYDGEFKKKIDLTGAEIGGGLALSGVQGVALELQNAKIGILSDLADGWPPTLKVDGLTYRSVVTADKFEEWLRKIDHYSPQPYEQLAYVVQSQGNSTLATAIRYAGRERERSEATGRTWAWLTALKWVIGYGYHPERSILWALGLVATGAVVLRISGEGPRNGMPFGLAFSFDTLLPIIKLRDVHYQIDLKTWARYYFYGHKIMGYVLASFLIAGLSGLTK